MKLGDFDLYVGFKEVLVILVWDIIFFSNFIGIVYSEGKVGIYKIKNNITKPTNKLYHSIPKSNQI